MAASLRGIGALRVRVFRVGGGGSTNTVTRLVVVPGWRLAGLAAGRARAATEFQSLPASARMAVVREETSDVDPTIVRLPPDGWFSLRLRPEHVVPNHVAKGGGV
jgi:hypothetical protein